MILKSAQLIRKRKMQPASSPVRMLVTQTGAVMLLIGVACIPSVGQMIAMGTLIVAACFSPIWALKSFAAGVAVASINPAFSSGQNSIVFVLKWLLLFVVCGRSLLSRIEVSKTYELLMGLWVLMTASLLINAYFVSLFPPISLLKAVSFSIGVLCCIRLAALTANRNAEMMLFIAELGMAVFVLSIPLLAVPGIGKYRNDTSFQGVLSHPQTMGIFLIWTGQPPLQPLREKHLSVVSYLSWGWLNCP